MMKKTLSLAMILSIAAISPSWAEAPRGSQPEPKKGLQNKEQPKHQEQAVINKKAPPAQGKNQPTANKQGNTAKDGFTWHGNNFRKGQPAPPAFRGQEYQINDWHNRGLPTPPDGHHWSYIDGHYVLIAAATGIITSILINSALNH